VQSRAGHLFPGSLVASQFAALESPQDEAGVLTVSALAPTAAQCQAVVDWLAAGLAASSLTLSSSVT
jgi:gluconokinase